MTHPFSLAHLCALDLSPPELIMVAADAGYDFVGLRLVPVMPGWAAWALWQDKPMMAMTKARMAETGVRVLDVEVIKLEPETEVAGFEGCFSAAAEIGARHVLTQSDDPEQGRLVDHYGALCDLAAGYGLTCDIEFIPWLRLNTLAKAAAVVASAGRPNGGVLIDTLHFFRSGASPEEIALYPPEWFRFTQLADAPARAPKDLHGLLYAAREERLFPGEGELDIKGVIARLPADLPLAIEIPTETLGFTTTHQERARMAREATERLLASLGR